MQIPPFCPYYPVAYKPGGLGDGYFKYCFGGLLATGQLKMMRKRISKSLQLVKPDRAVVT